MLKRYNLPTNYSIESVEKFYDQFFLDKKSHDNTITFIIPKVIGSYVMLENPEIKSVFKVLKKFEKDELYEAIISSKKES
ncbi:MAG TPA: hypothetical protein EYG93_00985 [Sulfurospirillum arcachonense]|nr:hypothetical protein [Sulfurospirillum arcachonense]